MKYKFTHFSPWLRKRPVQGTIQGLFRVLPTLSGPQLLRLSGAASADYDCYCAHDVA